MPKNFDLLVGALFGALGACMRTWLDVKLGVKVNPWLAFTDVAMSAVMGVLAYGIARELVGLYLGHTPAELWWTCAAASGMAGSIGPQIVRYVSIVLRKRFGITPEDLEDNEK